MRWVRGPFRNAGVLLWAVVLVPAIAIWPAAFLDEGPHGRPRFSVFPVALALLDPYVWECARNSVLVASAVTVVSGLIGVGVARLLVGWRFWGRRWLGPLACAGMAVPPAFGAIGLRWALDGGLHQTGPSPWFEVSAWAAWFWVALASGAPVVGLAAYSAFGKVNPAWEDAAVWAGSTRRRAWRKLAWPMARPEVAKALGAVFTFTVLEPGAPIVLGLRRTLSAQVVRSALAADAPGELTRAVVLALFGTMLAWTGRALIIRWGGKDLAPPPSPTFRPKKPILASWKAGAALAGLLIGLIVIGWAPWMAMVAASFAGPSDVYSSLARDPVTRGYILNSALLGVAVLCVTGVLARVVIGLSTGRLARMIDWPAGVPPLAVGVGALAAPVLLSWFAPASVASWFDPDRTPWLALILAVSAVRLPLMAESAARSLRSFRQETVDAAVVLGASRRRELRRATGGFSGAGLGAMAATFALAATGVSPALLLCPTADVRTLGPAAVMLADSPGPGIEQAAALATLAVALNVGAFVVAAWRRVAGPDGSR